MGALTVHASGRTNVAPAREAWERALAAEYGIGDDLEPAERQRRVQSALRLRMTRLAMARWGNRKAGSEIQRPDPAEEDRRGVDDLPPAD